MSENLLVFGRQCGSCTACCQALSIEAPTLTKPNGVACPHLCGTGCNTYDARPGVCRDWYCGWRMFAGLDDRWRPDRCGFLVEMLFDTLPEGFTEPALRFTLLWSVDDLFWPPFVELVTRAVAMRQPVFLCLPGPAGYLPAQSLLNVPAFVAAVDAGDQAAISRGLKRAGDSLEMHHWVRKSA